MLNMLRQRRSIRKFLPKQVEPDKWDVLKEALLRSPTSRNRKSWEFIFVDDPDLLTQLARAKQSGSSFLKGAPLAVVILGNEQKSDVWIEDCAIAAIILQLAAVSIGLGSCWVQIRKREHDDDTSAEAYVQRFLKIPSHLKVECIIGIGYADESRPGVTKEQLDAEKIHINGFGKPADRV